MQSSEPAIQRINFSVLVYVEGLKMSTIAVVELEELVLLVELMRLVELELELESEKLDMERRLLQGV